jgi:hypothetical protein
MRVLASTTAPENSFPQLGQVRRESVLMGLTALQAQPDPKATPPSTESCEIGQYGLKQTVVPLHKQLRITLY